MKNITIVIALLLGSSMFAENAFSRDRAFLEQAVQYGVCHSGDLTIKMQNVLKIENRTIFSQDPSALWHSSRLVGSRIEFFDAEGKALIPPNMHYYIKDDSILDIRLSFALYNKKIVLYWEETYENRTQKLGLMTFNLKSTNGLSLGELEFIDICRGGKGADSSH